MKKDNKFQTLLTVKIILLYLQRAGTDHLILKTISTVHIHCSAHIGNYFLTTGTGVDDIAPLSLTSLFSVVSELSGKDLNLDLIGIFGLGPFDDFGILSASDQNIRLFLLFEGAGTDQIPCFQDQSLRKACNALFKVFNERIPKVCSGPHYSEDTTIEYIVSTAFPSGDLPGVTHIIPTHEIKILLKGDEVFSQEVNRYSSFGDGFLYSDVGQAIESTIENQINRASDVSAYWQALQNQLSEFMDSPPQFLLLLFGPSHLASKNPSDYPKYVSFIEVHPSSLHCFFGISVDPNKWGDPDELIPISKLRKKHF